MRRFIILVLLALPLFAQLPAGVERRAYPDDGPTRDPRHLVVTADGALWAASFTEAVVDRFDADGTSRRFDLPEWGIHDMIAGPDGALWIGTRHYLGRLDPETGLVQPFFTFSGVRRVLAGPDGNLWILETDNDTNRVGNLPRFSRVTTGGVLLERFRPGGVVGQTFASDGALWLAITNPHRLVRRTTDGQQTPWAVEQAGQLFAGPGFLWMTSGDRIVRRGLDAQIIGTYRVGMTPVAADAAGNLWFREDTGAGIEIAQLTPGGVLTRFAPLPPLPATACIFSEPGGSPSFRMAAS